MNKLLSTLENSAKSNPFVRFALKVCEYWSLGNYKRFIEMACNPDSAVPYETESCSMQSCRSILAWSLERERISAAKKIFLACVIMCIYAHLFYGLIFFYIAFSNLYLNIFNYELVSLVFEMYTNALIVLSLGRLFFVWLYISIWRQLNCFLTCLFITFLVIPPPLLRLPVVFLLWSFPPSSSWIGSSVVCSSSVSFGTFFCAYYIMQLSSKVVLPLHLKNIGIRGCEFMRWIHLREVGS